jgi:hypothetical protein
MRGLETLGKTLRREGQLSQRQSNVKVQVVVRESPASTSWECTSQDECLYKCRMSYYHYYFGHHCEDNNKTLVSQLRSVTRKSHKDGYLRLLSLIQDPSFPIGISDREEPQRLVLEFVVITLVTIAKTTTRS